MEKKEKLEQEGFTIVEPKRGKTTVKENKKGNDKTEKGKDSTKVAGKQETLNLGKVKKHRTFSKEKSTIENIAPQQNKSADIKQNVKGPAPVLKKAENIKNIDPVNISKPIKKKVSFEIQNSSEENSEKLQQEHEISAEKIQQAKNPMKSQTQVKTKIEKSSQIKNGSVENIQQVKSPLISEVQEIPKVEKSSEKIAEQLSPKQGSTVEVLEKQKSPIKLPIQEKSQIENPVKQEILKPEINVIKPQETHLINEGSSINLTEEEARQNLPSENINSAQGSEIFKSVNLSPIQKLSPQLLKIPQNPSVKGTPPKKTSSIESLKGEIYDPLLQKTPPKQNISAENLMSKISDPLLQKKSFKKTGSLENLKGVISDPKLQKAKSNVTKSGTLSKGKTGSPKTSTVPKTATKTISKGKLKSKKTQILSFLKSRIKRLGLILFVAFNIVFITTIIVFFVHKINHPDSQDPYASQIEVFINTIIQFLTLLSGYIVYFFTSIYSLITGIPYISSYFEDLYKKGNDKYKEIVEGYNIGLKYNSSLGEPKINDGGDDFKKGLNEISAKETQGGQLTHPFTPVRQNPFTNIHTYTSNITQGKYQELIKSGLNQTDLNETLKLEQSYTNPLQQNITLDNGNVTYNNPRIEKLTHDETLMKNPTYSDFLNYELIPGYSMTSILMIVAITILILFILYKLYFMLRNYEESKFAIKSKYYKFLNFMMSLIEKIPLLNIRFSGRYYTQLRNVEILS